MSEFVYKLFISIVVLSFIYAIFFEEYQEYECNELVADSYASGTKVYFYKGGGVLNVSENKKYKSNIKHKVIEGTDYISYLRSNEAVSYKLDKRDLTYYYRLGNRKGQCTKVGIIDKIDRGSYSSADAEEYDY